MLHDHEADHVLPLCSLGHDPVSDLAHSGTRSATVYDARLQYFDQEECQHLLIFSLVKAPPPAVRGRILIESF